MVPTYVPWVDLGFGIDARAPGNVVGGSGSIEEEVGLGADFCNWGMVEDLFEVLAGLDRFVSSASDRGWGS